MPDRVRAAWEPELELDDPELVPGTGPRERALSLSPRGNESEDEDADQDEESEDEEQPAEAPEESASSQQQRGVRKKCLECKEVTANYGRTDGAPRMDDDMHRRAPFPAAWCVRASPSL